MKRMACMILMLAVMPAAAEAQRRSGHNAFGFAPYVGVYQDAYDAAADGSDRGWIVGFKAEYQESSRLTLHANLGYANSDDVATRPLDANFLIVDNHWVIMTGGASFALVPGNTSVAVGADAGVAWRQTKARTATGTGSDDGWAAYEVVAPSLTMRHRFTPRAGVFVTLQDYISDVLEGNARHSPALTVGLTFR